MLSLVCSRDARDRSISRFALLVAVCTFTIESGDACDFCALLRALRHPFFATSQAQIREAGSCLFRSGFCPFESDRMRRASVPGSLPSDPCSTACRVFCADRSSRSEDPSSLT